MPGGSQRQRRAPSSAPKPRFHTPSPQCVSKLSPQRRSRKRQIRESDTCRAAALTGEAAPFHRPPRVPCHPPLSPSQHPPAWGGVSPQRPQHETNRRRLPGPHAATARRKRGGTSRARGATRTRTAGSGRQLPAGLAPAGRACRELQFRCGPGLSGGGHKERRREAPLVPGLFPQRGTRSCS